MAVCGTRFIDLNNGTLKMLGAHLSYNKELKEENNFFNAVTDIQNIENEKPYTRRENCYF